MPVCRSRVLSVATIAVVLLALAVPVRAEETLDGITFVDARQLAEGSPAACVIDAVHQGLTVAQAVETCALQSLELPSVKGVNSFLATGGGLGRGTKHGSVTCAPTGSDPRISADGGSSGRPPHYYGKDSDHLSHDHAPPGKDWGGWANDPGYRTLKDAADEQWRQYYQALENAALNDTGKDSAADAALRQRLEKELKEANDAIQKRDQWRPSTVQVSPDAPDACADLRVFVAECNRDGWTSPECREAERRMRGCADPRIAMPLPDTTETCPPDEPDPETVQAVLTVLCSRLIHPAPGEDPCATTTVKTSVVRGYVHDIQTDPCGDPRAMPGQDQCAPTLTLATFGQTSLEDIVRIGNEKLGGPVFVVPLTPPGPIGPGPK